MAYRKLLLNGNAPRGVEIRRDIPILESKAANERRRAERAAAGLTNDFKLAQQTEQEIDAVQDPRYFREQLGDTTNLGWDEL
jgi:hypothetical protein